MCEHLPESDSKHPCICSMGKRSGLQTLWGTPGVGRTPNYINQLSAVQDCADVRLTLFRECNDSLNRATLTEKVFKRVYYFET